MNLLGMLANGLASVNDNLTGGMDKNVKALGQATQDYVGDLYKGNETSFKDDFTQARENEYEKFQSNPYIDAAFLGAGAGGLLKTAPKIGDNLFELLSKERPSYQHIDVAPIDKEYMPRGVSLLDDIGLSNKPTVKSAIENAQYGMNSALRGGDDALRTTLQVNKGTPNEFNIMSPSEAASNQSHGMYELLSDFHRKERKY